MKFNQQLCAWRWTWHNRCLHNSQLQLSAYVFSN